MALTSAKRREKWGWLPVLFLKAKGRPETAKSAPTLGANAQSLLRMVAHMLPQCVAREASERRELQEISDQLEVLAGGLPENEWADALASELAVLKGNGAISPSIRVSWGLNSNSVGGIIAADPSIMPRPGTSSRTIVEFAPPPIRQGQRYTPPPSTPACTRRSMRSLPQPITSVSTSRESAPRSETWAPMRTVPSENV